ncbi:MAG: LCP family protein [Armatimonadota bacterium]|jgi:LCP family protein required for cell wall assembly
MQKTRRKVRINFTKLSKSLILLFLAIFGCIFSYYVAASPTMRAGIGILLTRGYSPQKAFAGKDSVDILLLGRDFDRNEHGQVVHTRGRTDAIMLARFNFRERTANILSIPRDTLVRIPGYGGRRRINSANALGGPELTAATVSQLLGIDPDRYILVNLQGFEKAIDAMGGLIINVDKQMDYDDNWGNLHIHLKPGRQKLTGNQAMGFVRYRKSKDGDAETDFVRISRQQEFMKSAKKRLCCRSTLMRAPMILDIIRKDVQSNLSSGQQLCLLHFIKKLSKQNGIRMETLPALEDGGNYVHMDPNATRELVRQMFPSKTASL